MDIDDNYDLLYNGTKTFDITFNPFIVLTLAGQKSIVDKNVKRGMGDAREYAKK